MKPWENGYYKALVGITLLSFFITLESARFLSCAIQTLLALTILVYTFVSGFRCPESRDQYPIRYLLYFWLTAVVFCLFRLMAAWGHEIPISLGTSLFMAFPIISLGLVAVRPKYKVVVPYIGIQVAFLLAFLMEAGIMM